MPGRDIDHRAVEQGRTGRQGRTFADWYEQESQAVRSAYEQGDLFGGYRRLNQMNQKLMENETMLQAMATNPAVSHNDEARRYANAARRALEGHHDTSIPAHLKDPVDNPNVVQFEARKMGMNLSARRYFETARNHPGESAFADEIMRHATGMVQRRIQGGKDDEEKQQLEHLGFQASGANSLMDFAQKHRLGITAWIAGFDPRTQTDEASYRVKIESPEDEQKRGRFRAVQAQAETDMVNTFRMLHGTFGDESHELLTSLTNHLNNVAEDNPLTRSKALRATAQTLAEVAAPLFQSGAFTPESAGELAGMLSVMLDSLGDAPGYMPIKTTQDLIKNTIAEFTKLQQVAGQAPDAETLRMQFRLASYNGRSPATRGPIDQDVRDYSQVLGTAHDIARSKTGTFGLMGGQEITHSLGQHLARQVVAGREMPRDEDGEPIDPREWINKMITGGEALTEQEQEIRAGILERPLMQLVSERGFAPEEAEAVLNLSLNGENLQTLAPRLADRETFYAAYGALLAAEKGYTKYSPLEMNAIVAKLDKLIPKEDDDELRIEYREVLAGIPGSDGKVKRASLPGRERAARFIRKMIQERYKEDRELSALAGQTGYSPDELSDLVKRGNTAQGRLETERSYQFYSAVLQSGIQSGKLNPEDTMMFANMMDLLGAALSDNQDVTAMSVLQMFEKLAGQRKGLREITTATAKAQALSDIKDPALRDLLERTLGVRAQQKKTENAPPSYDED